MDPISAVGISLSVAGLAGQLFTGCIQCIEFILHAKDMPKECQYLNLRLRMEQQRLFAWSESSGLLDYDSENTQKVLESNVFGLHRSTVLELLVQIKVLFEDFEKHQKRYERLETLSLHDVPPGHKESEPSKEAAGLVPLAPRRRLFIEKSIKIFKMSSKGGVKRLRWASFDRTQFEQLLQKFSMLNDGISALLDARLQDEIYSVTQDTNRGVLQLHHNLADLKQLVKATLAITFENKVLCSVGLQTRGSERDNVEGLETLAQLARFKAFNESVELESLPDDVTAEILNLGNLGEEKRAMKIEKSCIELDRESKHEIQASRCEAAYTHDGFMRRVWVEWKEYDCEGPGVGHPPPGVADRAQRLAALLHHEPKPKYFRVPHCLGYFDDADNFDCTDDDDDEDRNNYRIGFVFEKPNDVPTRTPPTSLLELLRQENRPSVTERIAVAKAIANCILYLHSVNWLHKGLRSHNIVFFRTKEKKIDYSRPYIAGFDFARPARPGEQTEIPVDSIEYNLYRHPKTQNTVGDRENYRKSFDIYSLGVVLVELAHWQTIDQILDIDVKMITGRRKVVQGVRQTLLTDKSTVAVGASMGEVYEQVVKKCLTGGQDLGIGKWDDETSDLQVAARLSMVFYEDVVKRLEEIRI